MRLVYEFIFLKIFLYFSEYILCYNILFKFKIKKYFKIESVGFIKFLYYCDIDM